MIKTSTKKINKQIEFFDNLLEKQGYCYDVSKLHSIKKYDRTFSLMTVKKNWESFLNKKRESALDLYVHIPFCHSKCSYCVYPSWQVNDQKIVDEYIKYLASQAKFFYKTFKSKKFHCFYIGGGTPNILSYEQFNSLLSSIFKYFKFEDDASDRTCEFNPTWADEKKLKLIKNFGFNRISFGVQSLSDRTLAANNRGYQKYVAVKKAIILAKKIGFKKINVDLMLGFPTDEPADFIDSFKKIAKLKPSSIIVYGFHPPEKYLRELRLNRQDFFQDKYPKFVKKIMNQMPELCQEPGFIYDSLDPAKFHWGFRHKSSLSGQESSIEYSGEFSRDVLGLGFCSRSHLTGVAEYRQNIYQNKINYQEKIFEGKRLDQKDEMIKFVIDSIDQKLAVSLVTFEALFNKRLEEVFPYAISALKKCKIIKEKGGLIHFYFRVPKEKYIYTSFFVYEGEI